jgi:hypothetical protein
LIAVPLASLRVTEAGVVPRAVEPAEDGVPTALFPADETKTC